MKACAAVCSLLVAVCVSCFSQTTEPLNFNPDDPQVISNVQEILSLLGYGHLPLGPMNKQTVKELKKYQAGRHIAATGKIDLATYRALLNDFEHPPTFSQIRDAGKLPRWATSVCLEEQSLNKNGKMEESPEESDPKTASAFFVYGPKGNLDIQTEEYLLGRPFAHADWQREKSAADHAVFLSVILPGHHREARYMHLTINWSDSGAFVLELRSTNSNELRDRSVGHCRDIKF